MRTILQDYYQRFLGEHSKKKRTFSVLALLAVVVVGLVFFRLKETGVSLTYDSEAGNIVAPIETVDNNKDYANGITINLFDYEASDDLKANNNKQSYINAGKDLYFLPNGGTLSNAKSETGNSRFRAEDYTGQLENGNGIALQGIVANQLVNNYPVLTFGQGDRRQSLEYLFDPMTSDPNVTVYPKTTGLFKKDNGWLVFNSDENYAYYNKEINQFGINQTTFNQTAPGNGNPIGFFPFDEMNNSKTNVNANAGYSHHFGLTMEADFTLYRDGKINDEDMMFFFSGDDDMWVFIDGVLVLDIGGIHDPVDGTINFATGKVYVSDATKLGVESTGDSTDAHRVPREHGSVNLDIAQIFADANVSYDTTAGSTHHLQVFYLERGGVNSNLLIKTNIFESQNVEVEKEWIDNGEDHSNDVVKYSLYKVYEDTKIKEKIYTGELNKANNWYENLKDLEPSTGSFHYEVVEDSEFEGYEAIVLNYGSRTDKPPIPDTQDNINSDQTTDGNPGADGSVTPKTDGSWKQVTQLSNGKTYALAVGGTLIRYINQDHYIDRQGATVGIVENYEGTIQAVSQWYYANGHLQNVAAMNAGTENTYLANATAGHLVNNQYWYLTTLQNADTFRVDPDHAGFIINQNGIRLTNDSYISNSSSESAQRSFTIYEYVEGDSSFGSTQPGGSDSGYDNENMNSTVYNGDKFTIVNRKLDPGAIEITKEWRDENGVIDPLDLNIMVQLYQVKTLISEDPEEPETEEPETEEPEIEDKDLWVPVTQLTSGNVYLIVDEAAKVALGQPGGGRSLSINEYDLNGENNNIRWTYENGLLNIAGKPLSATSYNAQEGQWQPSNNGTGSQITFENGKISTVASGRTIYLKNYNGWNNGCDEANATVFTLYEYQPTTQSSRMNLMQLDVEGTSEPAMLAAYHPVADDAATDVIEEAYGDPFELTKDKLTYTFKNLPLKVTEDGKTYACTYYAVEVGEDDGVYTAGGYTFSVDYSNEEAISQGTILITNTYEGTMPQTTKIAIEKLWKDCDNNSIEAPANVDVLLYQVKTPLAGGDAITVETPIMSVSVGSAKQVIENLPKSDKESGVAYGYTYFIREAGEQDHIVRVADRSYNVEYSNEGAIESGQFTITNNGIWEPNRTDLTVHKEWVFPDDDDEYQTPDKVIAKLYRRMVLADGDFGPLEIVEGYDNIELNADGLWTKTLSGIPTQERESGIIYDYVFNFEESVAEDGRYYDDAGNRYDVSYTVNEETDTTTIYNTLYAQDRTSVTVEKKWQDYDGSGLGFVAPVDVKLKQVLTKSEAFSGERTRVYAFEEGETYVIQSESYVMYLGGDPYEQYADLTVRFNGTEDADEHAPSVDPQEDTFARWTYEDGKLYTMRDGTKYYLSIRRNESSAGIQYNAYVEVGSTETPGTVELNGNRLNVTANGATRPLSTNSWWLNSSERLADINIWKLDKDTTQIEKEVRSVTLSSEKTSHVFSKLPIQMSVEGELYDCSYYVVEDGAADDDNLIEIEGKFYTVSYSNGADPVDGGSITITNTKEWEPEDIEVSVEKQYDFSADTDNEFDHIKSEVVVALYRAKDLASATPDFELVSGYDHITLNESNEFTMTVTVPSQVEEDDEIYDYKYEFREVTEADGYFHDAQGNTFIVDTKTDDESHTTIITNILRVAGSTNVTVTKTWTDSDGNSIEFPDEAAVTMQLWQVLTPMNSAPGNETEEATAFEEGESYVISQNDGSLFYLSTDNHNNQGLLVRTDGAQNTLDPENDTYVVWTYENGHLYTELNGTRYYLATGVSGSGYSQLAREQNPATISFVNGKIKVVDGSVTRYISTNRYWMADSEGAGVALHLNKLSVNKGFEQEYLDEITLTKDMPSYKYPKLPTDVTIDNVDYTCTYYVKETGLVGDRMELNDTIYYVSYSTTDPIEGGTITVTNRQAAPGYTPGPAIVEFKKYIDDLDTQNYKDGEPSLNPDTSFTADSITEDLYRIYLDIQNHATDTPVDLLIVVDQSGSMFEKQDVTYMGQSNQYRDMVLSAILNGSATMGNANMTNPPTQDYDPNNTSNRRYVNATVTDQSLINLFLALNEENQVAVIGFDADRFNVYRHIIANNLWNTEEGNRLTASFPYTSAEGYSYEKDSREILAWTSEPLALGSKGINVEGRYLSGTNYEAGLIRAEHMFNDDEALKNNGHQKVMIFFSDGVPTCYIEDEGNGKYHRGGTTLSGSLENPKDTNILECVKPSIEAFEEFKKNCPDVTVYSIGVSGELSDDDESSVFGSRVLSKYVTDTGSYFFAGHNGNDLKNELIRLLLPATPIKAIITDELSRFVEYYEPQPDLLVSMKDLTTGETTPIWKNGQPITGAGTFVNPDGLTKPIVQSAGYTENTTNPDSTGTVQVVFDPDYIMTLNHIYTVSFNVKVTEAAYEAYEANQNQYPEDMIGQKDSDYNVDGYENATSYQRPGFYSNENAYVKYQYEGTDQITRDYYHPVVQIDTADITVTKNWQDADGADADPMGYIMAQIVRVKERLFAIDDDSDGQASENPDNDATAAEEEDYLDPIRLESGHLSETKTGLPIKGYEDGVLYGYKYYVRELDTEGKPYEASYLVDKDAAINTDGELTIINTVDNDWSMELPNAGGNGTKWYTWGPLIAGAMALLLGYFVKRKQGRRSDG